MLLCEAGNDKKLSSPILEGSASGYLLPFPFPLSSTTTEQDGTHIGKGLIYLQEAKINN